jgi:hypothetical protein
MKIEERAQAPIFFSCFSYERSCAERLALFGDACPELVPMPSELSDLATANLNRRRRFAGEQGIIPSHRDAQS